MRAKRRFRLPCTSFARRPKPSIGDISTRALAPVLTVKSGDLIQAEAVTHHAGDDPELMFDAGVEAIFREVPEADRNPGVHIMTGPIFVEGAKPGDMLEVRYLSMTPRNRYGHSNLAANWGLSL